MVNLFDSKIDAYVILNPANRFYFTQFDTSFGAVIATRDKKIFITDFRYQTEAKNTLTDFDILTTTNSDFMSAITDTLKKLNVKNVGYEDDYITVGRFKDLKATLGDFTLKPAAGNLAALRAIKTEEEIALIASAQTIAEKSLKKVIENIKPGVSEREVAAGLVYEMTMGGAQKASFDVIVAFGDNAAAPHHTVSDKRLEKNDVILIDMGAKYKGYCSDLTRTFCLDTPDPALETIYDIVKQAQNYALKFIKAGMTGHEADSLAREYITANGYGKEFGHSLGHGVGINIHEFPRLGLNSQDVLEENMVVTVEPGIYVENLGGVRIEDLVVVKSNGIVNLTQYDKEFIL